MPLTSTPCEDNAKDSDSSYAVMRRLGLEARKKKLPCIIVPQATPRASLMRGSYSKREHVA